MKPFLWNPLLGKPRYEYQARLNPVHPLNQGLHVWSILNEAAGTATYDLINNRRGTFGGSAAWGTTRFGPSAYFGASTSDVVDFGDTDFSSFVAITVLMDLVPSRNASNEMLAEDGTAYNTNSFYLYLDAGKPSFEIYAGSHDIFTATNAVTAGVPISVAGRWSAVGLVRCDLLINGVPVAGTSTGTARDSPLINGNSTLQLGKRPGSTALSYQGYIGSISIWNRRLSDSDLAYLYAYPYGTPDNPRLIVPMNYGADEYVAGTTAVMDDERGMWRGIGRGMSRGMRRVA